MKGICLIISCLAVVFTLNAQTTDGLVAYYDFNDSTATDRTGAGSNGNLMEDPTFICGPDGVAIRLDGEEDHVAFFGLINNYFERDDFTFSFFLHTTSVGSPLTQTIFSKRENCDVINAFSIRYAPNSNSVSLEMSENSSKRVNLNAMLDNKCWEHITVVRAGTEVRLFINGQLRSSDNTASRIDISNTAALLMGDGPCVDASFDDFFNGAIDELRMYDRALNNQEVAGLYDPLVPDNIITPDQTIFLGNEVQIVSGSTCADEISWTPTDNLSDPFISEPLISPEETAVYYVSFSDTSLSCISYDSIRIAVIDPDDLDCSKAFLPNAFTPNGDNLNDTYGISNPYAIAELISFEIFDRWGGRVFLTTNPMEKWDGNFQGQPMNPGILLYKVIHICNGEELVEVGNMTLLR